MRKDIKLYIVSHIINSVILYNSTILGILLYRRKVLIAQNEKITSTIL